MLNSDGYRPGIIEMVKHDYDIPLQFTFTNNSITFIDLNDFRCNYIMKTFENENHEIKDSSERLAAFADDRPAVKDATSPDYKPVPYHQAE